MRIESTVFSVSWIPSESISGLLRGGSDIGLTLLGGGVRTSTVVALTPVRLAVAQPSSIDDDSLQRLSALHRREQ